MIYTSYFGKLKKIPKDYICVSIAYYTPTWFEGLKEETLAPDKQLLIDYKNGEVGIDRYTKLFNSKLEKLNKDDIRKHLESLGENVVLLCYEKPENFCHRQIVAKWLGEDVEEWDYD